MSKCGHITYYILPFSQGALLWTVSIQSYTWRLNQTVATTSFQKKSCKVIQLQDNFLNRVIIKYILKYKEIS